MPLRRRPIASAALVAAVVAVLAGCSGPSAQYADLGGEREARDELPALADYAYDSVDVDSSRFVGEHDGTSVWLTRGLDRSEVCLVADAGVDDWLVACGGGVAIDGTAGSFSAVPDGAPAPEGATKVSENVYALP